mmetsp:Transcript_1498/g.2990  ORF Transcript_1498/g.2990 Transcript_1498/m.2990 type:complete len:644 (-) Transcript_1498:1480-3411(-)
MLFKRKKGNDDSDDSSVVQELGIEVLIDDGKDKVALPQDIFSLFFVSPVCSVGFLYSLCCFALQMGIHFLILYNLLRDAPEGNPLKVPLRVENDVVAAQCFALLVSLVAQEDVITTLNNIPVGYNHDILNTFGSATRIRWVISDFMRLLEGILSIMVSFIFIVQSTEVLELFANFAAMQFVSMLDNIGFSLAHYGYITNGLVRVASDVKKIRFPCKNDIELCCKIKMPSLWALRSILLLLTACLYVFWANIRIQQASGYFINQVCQNFDIRFGDYYYDFFEAQPCNTTTNTSAADGCPWKNRTRPLHYGPFSDYYKAARDADDNLDLDKNGRPVYYQRGSKEGFGEGSPPGKFSYCDSEDAWVFTVEGVTKQVTDSCNWLMRSPQATDAYSLHEASSAAGWSIWTGILQDASSSFEISCGECETDVDCNYHGSCVEKQCVCEMPWIGTKCQTCAACTQLSQKVLRTDFGNEDEDIPFIQLPGSIVYDRPVYFKNGTSIGACATNVYGGNVCQSYEVEKLPNGTIEVLFYAGTRYYIMIWQDFMADYTLGMTEDDLDRLGAIFKGFHSTWNLDDNPNQTIAVYTDVTTNPMPLEVKWNVFQEAPLAIFGGGASGAATPVDSVDFDCAIESEKTACAFQSSSKSV